ncbi:MAG: DNA gyrase/topoisomerase IV subunit A [Flavobacteriales bacterium]|nr:DNA gyrase/topoisomerase IV subunit A [Flavobacteriales bacterium]
MSEIPENIQPEDDSHLGTVIQVNGLYETWFLDYASYVILERAVPHINDGLKPVQRRILHSLWEMDDGRFNKVANVIGNTMKYHPHGDASIGDALVQLGQKNLLLDMQGNWGNIYTGDNAAAPRYIEVRLNKFALEVVFNPKTTTWLASYDGRNKEPETLPVKFPLLLALGVEGIAVGLACKILPHNFIELIDASIDVLRGKRTHLMPDFQQGGFADCTDYNHGLRGGKIRVRARIRKEDNGKQLVITEIPFGTTVPSLIDSILKANEKGKIKVKKVDDITTGTVEIIVHLAPGTSPDKTIDALYAFTDCEVSISPNVCVIQEDKPRFIGVDELLRMSTEHTRDLIEQELKIQLAELDEQWFFSSLEKIFIEKRIYRKIEEAETWEEIISTIHKGVKPFTKDFFREVTDEDVARLTEIKIKRISRFDSFKADEHIKKLEGDIKDVKKKLKELIETCIEYFKELKRKYGKGKERRTEIKQFDTVEAAKVAIANAKLYVNRAEGFVGTGLKRDEGEYVMDCSDIDDIIIFRNDGKMMVKRVEQKSFVGKEIIHAGVWKKDDKRTIYNLIYSDGKKNGAMMKRFAVTSITRDKEYDLTKGTAGSEMLYFSANPNGEAEVVTINLRAQSHLKKLKFDIDFSELAVKGRDAVGNVVTKYTVRKVELKEAGLSTLGALQVWYDEHVHRLNSESRGRFVGDFYPGEKILMLLNTGEYKLVSPELSLHFDETMTHFEKWIPGKPLTTIYYDGEKQTWFVKRFLLEESGRAVKFITEHPQSKLGIATTVHHPVVFIRYDKRSKAMRNKMDESVNLRDFIAVKGMKALGNKLTSLPVLAVELLEPDAQQEEQSEKLLMDMIRSRKGNPMDKEIHQNPADIEFEIDGLVDDMERFKQQKQNDDEEDDEDEKPSSPKTKRDQDDKGTQGSLF